MLLSLGKNGLDSLFKEVRVFKEPEWDKGSQQIHGFWQIVSATLLQNEDDIIQRGKNLGHSDLDLFTRTKVQN